jgi:hypothetical protein
MEGHSWNFSHDDPSESISDGSIDALQFHLQQFVCVLNDGDIQVLFEFCEVEDLLALLIFYNFFFFEF